MIVDNLSIISRALLYQNKFDEAFDFKQKALNSLKMHSSTDTTKIIQSLNLMGAIQRKQGKYNEVYDLFQEVLIIYEKNSPSLKADIPFTFISLNNIKYNERSFDESVNYYYRIVNILKEFYCADYNRIVLCLNWVAFNYYQKQSYDQAIEFYEQCLKIDEANSVAGQLTTDEFKLYTKNSTSV
ncbi:unnamed protein product [Adineta steineri]|uniref:Tetratricopeptide repeat protein n=1 Tax=Adineta steineri TaxID=433720 RepID=A0A819IH27_9BILA|nr:unnamed protein product [Adineta steineri]CAF3916359.1 unnamed protein product [Adineta steineri]